MLKIFLIGSNGKVIIKENSNYFQVDPPHTTYKAITYNDYLKIAYLDTDKGRVFPEHVAPTFSDWLTALSEIPKLVKKYYP